MKTIPVNHKRLMLSVLLICAIAGGSALSQVTRQWAVSYNGPGNTVDNAAALVVDGSGNVYVTGWSQGSSYNYATVKYNSSGAQQWVQTFDAENHSDKASSVAVDASGNVYVTGTSYVSATGYDFLTIKYSSSGTVLWTKRYDGGVSGIDQAFSVAVDASGNVFVTGRGTGSVNTSDFVTIKYNSSGVQQWAKAFTGGGSGNDFPSAMVIDAASNVYVTGKCYETATGYDYLTVKYSTAGTLLWFRKYSGYNAYEDGANAITVDGSGNVYVTGSSRMGSASSTSDYLTIKYDASGTQQWSKRYNGPGSSQDDAYSIAVDGAGNVIVTGASYGGASSFDFTTIKYNSSGAQQWVVRENGPNNLADRGFCAAVDGSGNIYVTGCRVTGGSSEDYMTIKYNSAGVQLWNQLENGTGNGADIASALKLDDQGNVIVTGYSTGSTGQDFTTVKYNQPLGIARISNEIPDDYSLSQNYPNPFNPVTNIKFSLPKSAMVTLVVYDINGREAAILVNQNLNAGSYNADFDALHLSSGTYFYRLITEGFTDVKKMVLVK